MRKNVSRLAILSLLIISMGCGDMPDKITKQSSQGKDGKSTAEKPTGESKQEPISIKGASDSLQSDAIAYERDSTLDALASEMYDNPKDALEDSNANYADDPADGADYEWEDEEDEASYNFIVDAEMDVEQDKLISTALVRVLRPEFSDQRDSVLAEIEKRLTITPERIPATVVVEKWISPVNFKGYKFNQRKLLLFGVREEQDVVIFYYVNHYYFALGERFYELDETLAFEPFQNLADTALVRHLRTYENSL